MESSLLDQLGIDPAYILIVMAAVIIILAVLLIIQMRKTAKLSRKYDVFMRGKDAETLEDVLNIALEDIKTLKAEDLANKDAIKVLNRTLHKSYTKMGLVKYDAFPGMGGKLSFSLALMAPNKSGFVMNVVHSTATCHVYIKEIVRGESEATLSKEEEKAVRMALGLKN